MRLNDVFKVPIKNSNMTLLSLEIRVTNFVHFGVPGIYFAKFLFRLLAEICLLQFVTIKFLLSNPSLYLE